MVDLRLAPEKMRSFTGLEKDFWHVILSAYCNVYIYFGPEIKSKMTTNVDDGYILAFVRIGALLYT
jgi:hypothetical protein